MIWILDALSFHIDVYNACVLLVLGNEAWSFLSGSVVRNLPANAGDTRDAGSVPGLGRSPGEGNATHSMILAWKIPWTEEPGGLQSARSQRIRLD